MELVEVMVNVGDEAIDHARVQGVYCSGCPISYTVAKMLKPGYFASVPYYEALLVGDNSCLGINGYNEQNLDYDAVVDSNEGQKIALPHEAYNWQADNASWNPIYKEFSVRPEPISFPIKINKQFLRDDYQN